MTTYPYQTAGRTEEKSTLGFLLLATPSTFHQATLSIRSSNPTSEEWLAPAVHMEDAYIRAYHALVPKRTIEEEEEEEREWDTIVSKTHVRQALRRMAAEVRRQIASGEIEEGGLVIE